MFAGLTKTGSPSASITSSAVLAPTSCSVNDSQRLWAMPCWASTCLAIALSMARAEPSTPLPTYGTSASSSIPWTVPSSPSGPCSSGSTTVGPDATAEARTGVAEVDRPSTGSPSGRASGSAAGPSAAAADSASSHSPSRLIPTAVMA